MLLYRINSTLLAMRDHIDSYLVLDTGSNDTTVETVRARTAPFSKPYFSCLVYGVIIKVQGLRYKETKRKYSTLRLVEAQQEHLWQQVWVQ